jgi:phosphomannomutase/phosphoglucomutase
MPMIDPLIFRAYDIRGKAYAQLDEAACRLIGQGFGTIVRRMYTKDHPSVVVGRDARTHSPLFEQAVADGLLSTGCDVIRIGQTPSPVNYFTICDQKMDAGIQITASHNPKDDNGIKLQVRDADAFSGEDLQRLRTVIEQEDFMTGQGSEREYNAVTPYGNHLHAMFADAGKEKKIVVDAGNGVAGPVNCHVLQQTGADIIGLYIEPDGEFPNHQPDPSKHSTLKDLQAKVQEVKADIGFAFDGDGDRLGIVDEQGHIRSADEILLLLAEDHLSRHPGAPVVFTVSNSETLNTEIMRWGGKPVMCKVGHSYVEHAMREHKATLGGEQSGHFFCGEDYYGFDDALVAALRILSILQVQKGKTISKLMEDFPRVYQTQELRPYCPDTEKAKIMASVIRYFQKDYRVNTLDGARIDFGDGAWAGIRQSNTSPCLSVCMEARSPEKLQEMETLVLDHLHTYGELTLES